MSNVVELTQNGFSDKGDSDHPHCDPGTELRLRQLWLNVYGIAERRGFVGELAVVLDGLDDIIKRIESND